MKFGLSPLQGGGSFEQTIQECERAEAAGFGSVFLGEHHNNPVLYPTPLVGLAAIASRTHRIRLGTGVLLLPLYHPVAVAEEGAMVDMISNGRLILGVGPGHADDGEIAALRYVFVAESMTRAQAIAGAPFINFFESTYFRWDHPVVKRPPGELTIERLAADRIILGDPATCVQHLRRLQEE